MNPFHKATTGTRASKRAAARGFDPRASVESAGDRIDVTDREMLIKGILDGDLDLPDLVALARSGSVNINDAAIAWKLTHRPPASFEEWMETPGYEDGNHQTYREFLGLPGIDVDTPRNLPRRQRDFAARKRQAIDAARPGMTQAAIAEAIGVHRVRISEWKRGDPGFAERLERALAREEVPA